MDINGALGNASANFATEVNWPKIGKASLIFLDRNFVPLIFSDGQSVCRSSGVFVDPYKNPNK